MSRLDDLPPDQQAALALLLRRGKSYAEVAALLSIPEQAVHDRAHAALAVLAPREARELNAERRADVGDYLLGQRTSVAERLSTRTFLEQSAPARRWATAIATELSALASAPLAEIPTGAGADTVQAAAGAGGAGGAGGAVSAARGGRDAPTERRDDRSTARATSRTAAQPRSTLPSSRLGGALLLAAIVAAVVVAVVLLSGGSGSPHASSSPAANAQAAGGGTGTSSTSPGSTGAGSTGAGSLSTGSSGAKASGATSSRTGSGATSSAARTTEDKRITLNPTDATSKSIGVAEVLSEGKTYAFYLAAEHLPASKGFFYAVWLYNSPTSYEALVRSPAVGSDGHLQGGALLPTNAGAYNTMLLTRETSTTPTRPGPIVLRGAFALH